MKKTIVVIVATAVIVIANVMTIAAAKTNLKKIVVAKILKKNVVVKILKKIVNVLVTTNFSQKI